MAPERSAEYVLGGSEAELTRLRAQAAEHEASTRSLLHAIGVRQGARVLDVGCGPIGILRLLSEAVGPDGEVVGLEREHRFAEMARSEIARQHLENTTVVEADALGSGLPRGSFDLVHERLVMVNVPERARLLTELVDLTAPGGVVALQDIDNVSWTCEPLHESWTVLLDAFHAVFQTGGGDPFIGRRLPSLLHEAGLERIRVSGQADFPDPGSYRRTHLLALLDSVREQVITSELMTESQLDDHRARLREHLDRHDTSVMDKVLVQAWGTKPR
jgi:ubiquinone/menaquinone biosynthesis C-methylase UbiE